MIFAFFARRVVSRLRHARDTVFDPFEQALRHLCFSDVKDEAVFLAHQLGQLILRTHRDDLPVIDDANPVAQLLRFFHEVGRVQHGHVVLVAELFDRVQYPAPALGIDADSGFVHVDQLRFVQ